MTRIRPSAKVRGNLLAVLVGVLVAVLAVALLGSAPPAGADEDDASPDQDQAAEQAPTELDDWGRDPNVVSGTIAQVCGPGPDHDAAAQRPGRIALIEWLDETYPDIRGFSGFVCREIHNRRTSCPGRTRPGQSSCWSAHAAGRAIDIGLGGAPDQAGTPVGKALGDQIVNHLLATVDGVPNYLARTMGVQQVLWDGRCWSTRVHADAGITDINQLDDDCIGGHDNHVHLTLSEAGANGRTSFYQGLVDPAALNFDPTGDPRDAHLLAYDAEEGRLLLRGLAPDGTFTDREASDEIGIGWTALATPDVAGNGNDELFVYDQADGRHEFHEIRADGTLGSQLGGEESLEPGWSLAASPDVDGDGDDELLLYRADDGAWVLYDLEGNGMLGTELQADDVTLEVFFTHAATPDLDGDGDDELVFYRQFDGHHVVADFADAEVLAEQEVAQPDGAEPAPDALPLILEQPVVDTDEDGAIDVAVTLATPSPSFVDDDGLPVDPGEVDELAALARAPGAHLGGVLTAGFTTMAAVDLDADGLDELALYRADDGCLAIRDLVPQVHVLDDTDAADGDESGMVDESLPPCLGESEDGDADETETDAEADDADSDEASEESPTWLLESRDALDPGWSTLLGTAVD